MPIVEILSQGDELLTGQIADTNAAWLSEQLTGLGFTVARHTTVGDDLLAIEHAIRTAIARADLVLCSGGLGPTQDDLTAQAVSAVTGEPLELDPVALATIERHYERYARPMPPVNRKQALLPRGCVRLDNDWGTAPGFAVATERGLAAFLPGVPRELRAMFRERVRPLLVDRLTARATRLITVRTTGVGESEIQERLGPFAERGVVLSYRTRLPENHVKLRFEPDYPPEQAVSVACGVAARIGRPVFCIEGVDAIAGDLDYVLVHTLLASGQTVATAESCTGGQVAAALTGIAGASGAFLEGVVCYSNASKQRLVGVPAELLAEHGAVSEPVARALAAGVRERAGATFGLATTGIAGPGGGSDDKPVGTVYIALATPTSVTVRPLRLAGDRRRVQALTTGATLDLLLRHLQGRNSDSTPARTR